MIVEHNINWVIQQTTNLQVGIGGSLDLLEQNHKRQQQLGHVMETASELVRGGLRDLLSLVEH